MHSDVQRLETSCVKVVFGVFLLPSGLQYTMFFKDPAGNNLEFKALRHPEQLFSKFTAEEQATSKE